MCFNQRILSVNPMVGAAFQPRSALPAEKRIAAGKPLPQIISNGFYLLKFSWKQRHEQ
jgi:hypothetical protein